VRALSADGAVVWSWAGVGGWLAIGNDETVYVAGDSTLTAIAPDGTVRWTRGSVANDISIEAAGDLGVMGLAPDLSVLSPSESTLWSVPMTGTWGSPFEPLYPVLGPADSLVYAETNALVAVTSGGDPLWRVPMSAPLAPPAVGADGTVFVVERTSQTLYGIGSDGGVRMTFDVQGRESHAAALIGGDGTVYLGLATAEGGRESPPYETLALTPQGAVVWMLPGGGLPMAIGADGTLYTNASGLTALRAD
jgi:outer membrane protein assembly factor BamB